jgi:uncharacterized protein YdaU (DUF1376 family)
MSHAWMPLYIADYLADTTHLSTVEHGAYLLLIMHYWQHGGLPTEDPKLARICRLTPSEWQEIKETISDLFGPDWPHKRIDEELVTADDITSKRSAAGKAGASARYGKRNSKRTAIATAGAEQTDIQTDTPSPSPSPLPSPLPSPEAAAQLLSGAADLEMRLREASGADGPALTNTAPITELIAKGYDLEDLILPVLREARARGKEGKTWHYYVPIIEEEAAKNAGVRPAPSVVVKPVVFIPFSDERWPAYAEKYQHSCGLPAKPTESKAGERGRHFPAEWQIPASLKRTPEAA